MIKYDYLLRHADEDGSYNVSWNDNIIPKLNIGYEIFQITSAVVSNGNGRYWVRHFFWLRKIIKEGNE